MLQSCLGMSPFEIAQYSIHFIKDAKCQVVIFRGHDINQSPRQNTKNMLKIPVYSFFQVLNCSGANSFAFKGLVGSREG
jgi:hypothetical protein